MGSSAMRLGAGDGIRATSACPDPDRHGWVARRCYGIRVRIAQVVPRGEQPWSGVLTVIVHLASALARRDHQVDVWQLHRWPPDVYREQQRRLEAAGVVQVPLLPAGRLGPAAASLAKERDIDVVHLHGAFNQSNTAVSRALRGPYVFSPHSGYDPVSLTRGRGRKLMYRVLFERTMLKRAALRVALTDRELGQLRALGVTGRIEVIPNGVEPAQDDLDRQAFRHELGLSADPLLAVFVGRLDVHRKGLDVLVRAVAAAPSWHLALVGPRFRDVDRLERIIADLGAGDRVHLVGERHGRRLQESVAAGDVFILMSRWEGHPMALLEAISLGKPAIVSPAVESLIGVDAAGAGWVTDQDELGPLLRDLQDRGRGELIRRGTAALGLSKRYDWDLVAERYESAYERALGSDGG
jgi:glycosyltransferase involved in cell wall biosynthesis